MSKFTRRSALACLVSSALLLTACNKDQPEPTQSEQQTQPSNGDGIGQLQPLPIQPFPANANDGHDIAILDDYERRFTASSDSMQLELEKMQQDNTLTPEFEQQRLQDNVQSALTMLKALELKTEQGRYIQGLMAGYWEQQGALLSGATSSNDSAEQVKQLNLYLHAQNQLQHWRSAQTADTQMQPE